MILRRDHVLGAILLVVAALITIMGGDLPAGTLGSPGPGLLPYISLAAIAVLAMTLLLTARNSPPFSAMEWPELSHTIKVTLIAALAVALYERLGFLITMAGMIFGVLALIEREKLWRAAAFALVVTIGAKLLLAILLKSPLPQGPFGF